MEIYRGNVATFMILICSTAMLLVSRSKFSTTAVAKFSSMATAVVLNLVAMLESLESPE